MGKKKTVDINGAPLEAVTIGEIKKSKYGWIGTILLFVLFISIVYFLPELSKYYQDFINGNATGTNNIVNNTVDNSITNNTTNETEESEEDTIITDNTYTFGSDLTVTKDNLLFSEISLFNNTLSFKVANNGEETVDLVNDNLYFETYDSNTSEKNILNTIMLTGILAAGQEETFFFEIKEGALYFDIKEITEKDYTYIVLEPDENNIARLTCIKDHETLSYEFVNDKLDVITISAIVPKIDANYDMLYANYHTLVIKYGANSGVNASLSTSGDNLNFNMNIDYTYFNFPIEGDYYFAKDTASRIVNFKMQSMLFDCK